MSNDTQDMEMGTKPVHEHEWLQQLVGDWKTEAEMSMGPDGPTMTSTGTEKVVSLGGLWAFGEGKTEMPGGEAMEYKVALGYDVSFKEYRGCWFASVTSHLWKYAGELSADGKKLTLNCVGPNMEKDGETANYRDVIEIIDENHRTLTSSGEDENGNWNQYMKVNFTRV
ncbi:MAG TPA: DUF1579 domain-containing protein [Fimbriimonadales bacterium]|jgi:hypothetical protein|nr:DUF1579 domain-containing protein [Fimbriimonadales bacterium]